MTELEQSIKSYFGVIAGEDLKTIVSLFKQTTLKKGEFIVKSGKRCKTMSFVQSGFLRMFVTTEAKEITQWISTKGYFSLDLASFIFETPSRWTIQAIVDTELFTISIEDYKKIGDRVPQWAELEKLFLVRCFTMLEDRSLAIVSESRLTYPEILSKWLPANLPSNWPDIVKDLLKSLIA